MTPAIKISAIVQATKPQRILFSPPAHRVGGQKGVGQ
jgi:hypothetical protein